MLAGVEAFKMLEEACRRRSEAISAQLTDLLLAPGPTPPVDQRLIDYNRGLIAGMRHATHTIPSEAARRLERFDQGQQQEEEQVEDFWSYPQPE